MLEASIHLVAILVAFFTFSHLSQRYSFGYAWLYEKMYIQVALCAYFLLADAVLRVLSITNVHSINVVGIKSRAAISVLSFCALLLACRMVADTISLTSWRVPMLIYALQGLIHLVILLLSCKQVSGGIRGWARLITAVFLHLATLTSLYLLIVDRAILSPLYGFM